MSDHRNRQCACLSATWLRAGCQDRWYCRCLWCICLRKIVFDHLFIYFKVVDLWSPLPLTRIRRKFSEAISDIGRMFVGAIIILPGNDRIDKQSGDSALFNTFFPLNCVKRGGNWGRSLTIEKWIRLELCRITFAWGFSLALHSTILLLRYCPELEIYRNWRVILQSSYDLCRKLRNGKSIPVQRWRLTHDHVVAWVSRRLENLNHNTVRVAITYPLLYFSQCFHSDDLRPILPFL